MKKIRPERHPPSLPGDPFAFYNLHHVTGGMIFAALYIRKELKTMKLGGYLWLGLGCMLLGWYSIAILAAGFICCSVYYLFIEDWINDWKLKRNKKKQGS